MEVDMPDRNYKAELVGVFGYPVAENPTVVMMEAAFHACGLNWRYLTIEVKPENLADAMAGLVAFGMRGVNLTIPHKIEVMKYLDEIAPDARLIGAVNTVVVKNGKRYGENTDGKGFLRSLREQGGIPISGSKVLLLGAGGAARSIAVELALAGAGHVVIANRTEKRGKDLVQTLNESTHCRAEFLPWDRRLAIPEDTDILVNATSIGLFPNTEALPDIDYQTIRPGLVVCDVIPNPPQTAFLKKAHARGARTIDGLGMLVNQGVIGFALWTGLDAPREVMMEALSKEFAS